MIEKKCEICGKLFSAKQNQQRFCKDTHIVKCPICGKDVVLDSLSRKRNYIKHGFHTCSQTCSKRQMLITNKNKYGYSTPFSNPNTQIKINKTMLDKYGYSSCMKNKEISKKVSETLRNKTLEERNMITAKIAETNMKRYGVKCGLLSPKRKQTMLKRYGAEYTGSSKILRDKMIKTNQEKFNCDFPFQCVHIQQKLQYTYPPEIKSILENKQKLYTYINKIPYQQRTIKYTADKLHVSYSNLCQYINKYELFTSFNHFTSTLEKSVETFVKSVTLNYQTHNRKLIYPYELDIYLPDYNVAIECNGTYYHSMKMLADKNYHYNKSKLCEEKGIRLIHIFEYEWNNERQRPILENIIKSALGVNKTIYARKLKIVVKQSKDMREFFNKNNIQGFRGGKFAICLVDKETQEVYMSYMMGHAFFGNGKYEWEVIRGATKLGYNVVGGASRIWKYFLDNYNPTSCVYYIDYNYFNGNSLKNLPDMEFIKTQTSFKNYFVDEHKVRNRDPIHHKQIKELYKQGKVWQIWNAGTKVYVWKSNNFINK